MQYKDGFVKPQLLTIQIQIGGDMSKVIVSGFSLSVDGFCAGPDQSLEYPLGKRGQEPHTWMFNTKMFKQMIGGEGGSEGVEATEND